MSADGFSASADAPADWWSGVQRDIAEREYQVTWQRKTCLPGLESAWQAPNRAQNLRTYFTSEGPRVVRRTESEPTWIWGLELVGLGNTRVPPVAETVTDGNRIEYRRDHLTEWYVNDRRGLEHAFTIFASPSPPLGEGRGERGIRLDLAVRGDLVPAVTPDRDTVEFLSRRGVVVIRCGGLAAWDADGQELSACMELLEETQSSADTPLIRLLVDTANAAYPVTISLVAAGAPWTAESDQAGALFGQSVATAGDVNGDGFSDVIVGAPSYDNGEANEGRVFVYHGSSSGLSAAPAWTAESDQADAMFGYSVATAGDVNGDDHSDVIVGAYNYDNGQANEGRAFVWYGSAAGLGANGTPANADWSAESNQAGAEFGWSVAAAGDVNNDGYDDVIIAAPRYDDQYTDEGRVFVFHGSASGLSPSAAGTLAGVYDQPRFGYSIATAGDVNGDGYDDVIVGAPYSDYFITDAGRVFVFHGSASGLGTSAAWIVHGDLSDYRLGISVATAGDVNGDGYADVIIGEQNEWDSRGRALVYHGSAGGLSPTAAWTAQVVQFYAQFGFSVASAGDVNRDGYSDVIIGARSSSNGGETAEGRAFAWYGSASGLGANGTADNADWSAESDQASARFGTSVATAGDVNGDGYSDVIVGAPEFDNGQPDEGRAFLYLGSNTGLPSPLPPGADWGVPGDQVGARFGWSVATAGDVNADGYSDVIIGARGYDSGSADTGRAFVYHGSGSGLAAAPAWTADGWTGVQFGWSVATAGDMNGDGYADVVVGAPYADSGETDEGMALIYYGSESGVSSFATITVESNQAGAMLGYSVSTAGDVNGDGYSDVIVGVPFYSHPEAIEGAAYIVYGGPSAHGAWIAEGNQVVAQFGYSVSTAGDVNGDGYADVIIGAVEYSNGQASEGRAFVYHGSASGLSSTAAWYAESNQANAWFGWSVAMAGDVNGDGYADVIVGAPEYDNGQIDEGRAYVYYGSESGLSPMAAWTAESNQSGAEMGMGVATAGDVNGDGYADVIVGARDYNNGEPAEGVAFIYHGSYSGLSGTPARTLEINRASSSFGHSVATAGDVNGDGYADVIVGAPLSSIGLSGAGYAVVYHGSPSGLGSCEAWTAESNQAQAHFATCVASAGDVNGDGYADVIVGAPQYDNGQTNEGRVYVYHGPKMTVGPSADWVAESDQAGAFFGNSVATAGDVNGDGYSDVIIGAHLCDNGQTDEGRVYLYLGSASGLGPPQAPAWTAESDQADAEFGASVATAGDVNGDGYADVIVGAPKYDNGETDEGAAFVWYGSMSGLAAGGTPDSASWTAEGNQAHAEFGFSVATAGDVNGDGYADLIIGAPGFTNVSAWGEGRAFVYLGSGSGLLAAPSWTAECDQEEASLGWSVATAGDVNGDGYSDVIIGVPYLANGENEEGVALVWHGSAGGLITDGTPGNADWFAESNQPNANLGYSVSTAGDVNGDGYCDVVVGAWWYDNGQTDEGRAFVYHGSASGLSLAPDWTAEGDQANARFGTSVAAAGDADADGYADIVVGASLWSDWSGTQQYEGRAFVFYGNGEITCGLRTEGVFPRQYRVHDYRPVAPMGLSDSTTEIRIGLDNQRPIPFGRGKVKVEVECKPLGTPLDGTGTTVDTDWVDTGSLNDFSGWQSVSGLSPDTVHHWRVRLLYHPATTPYQQYSRWFTPAWNGPEEGDFRTARPVPEMDWRSLFEFAGHWYEKGYSGWCDFTGGGAVDGTDLLELSRRWRE